MSTKVRVNLREMYPKYYNQDCFVEVDQDVYETMNKYDHIDAVYKRKVDYHKGYFSLDRSPFLELEKEGFDVNENILLKELIHQELISFIELTIKDLPVFYWSNETSRAEIDFVIQIKSDVVPVEVKAERNLQAKSLKVYMEKFKPNYAIRTSMADYKKTDNLIDLPLYVIEKIFL